MSLHDDRRSRLTRLFLIYHLLEMADAGHPVTMRDMQAACGCTRSTIKRDLKFLEEAEAVVRYDARGRTYLLERPLPQLEVALHVSDLLALAVAQGAGRSAGAPQSVRADGAWHKLTARLPVALREELLSSSAVLDFGGPMRRDYQNVPLQQLVEATRCRKTLEMTYYSIRRDTTSIRPVDPYHLTLRQGFFNLVAYCHDTREVRLFALDNIRGLRRTGQTFAMPAGFSLAEYMKGVVGGLRGELTSIVVRFDPDLARWAERLRWEFPHTTQREPDDSLLLQGQVSGLDAICKELLRWGAGVEAVEPPELRRMIRREAQSIAARYHEDA